VAVLEALGLYSPRNLSDLALRLNMPRPSLRYRIKNLKSNFSLSFYGNIYHTLIGLRKTIVFATAKPGYEELLYECLKANDYWLYLSQCVEPFKCLAVYGIPAGHEENFGHFLNQLQALGPANDVSSFWSTCVQTINATGTWFDKSSEEWKFPWNAWLEEIQKTEGKLPYTLIEPDEYAQKADWLDIMILKELEKDSSIKLTDIAKKFNTSLERVMYHFKHHVIEKGMFEGFQIIARHYGNVPAESYFFQFHFKNRENLTKYACSMINKPFARFMGKEYGQNRLFAQIYLPKEQLRNFTRANSQLIRQGFLENYEFLSQDITKTERQTISYEYFKNRSWKYDSEKYVENLKSTVKQFT